MKTNAFVFCLLVCLTGPAIRADEPKAASTRLTVEISHSEVRLNADRTVYLDSNLEKQYHLEGKVRLESKRGDLLLGDRMEVTKHEEYATVTVTNPKTGSVLSSPQPTPLTFTCTYRGKEWAIKATQFAYPGNVMQFKGPVVATSDAGDRIMGKSAEFDPTPGKEKLLVSGLARGTVIRGN